jgi:hypothetical protein
MLSLALIAGAVFTSPSVDMIAQTPPAAGANPVATGLRDMWNGAKRNITESADLMTEANYSFKPVDSVRTFGQILAHLAGANYVICAAAKGGRRSSKRSPTHTPIATVRLRRGTTSASASRSRCRSGWDRARAPRRSS